VAEFANSALAKNFLREHRNNRSLAHIGVGPTLSMQALTAHQLNTTMCGIYPIACCPKCSLIQFPSHSVHRTLGARVAVAMYVLRKA